MEKGRLPLAFQCADCSWHVGTGNTIPRGNIAMGQSLIASTFGEVSDDTVATDGNRSAEENCPVVADSNQRVVVPDQGHVQPDAFTADLQEDAEVLQASIRAGSVAQIVVAVIAVIGLIYLLKLVLVTALASLLLAFVLEPLVGGLVRIHVPRAVGALLAVVLMVGLAAASRSSFTAVQWTLRHSCRGTRAKYVPVLPSCESRPGR